MNKDDDYTDMIETAILDYVIKNNIDIGDVPFSLFAVSMHINSFLRNEVVK